MKLDLADPLDDAVNLPFGEIVLVGEPRRVCRVYTLTALCPAYKRAGATLAMLVRLNGRRHVAVQLAIEQLQSEWAERLEDEGEGVASTH